MFIWLKKNWAILLLVVIGLLYLKKNFNPLRPLTVSTTKYESALTGMDMAAPSVGSFTVNSRQVAPSDSPDRLVITDTSLSLQVKNVSDAINTISSKAKEFGGFLVTSQLSKPEMAASGSITVRVPTDKLQTALDAFRALAVKVVSESVVGTDVTDQYENLQAKLDILNQTKAKYQDILDKATSVQDILSVQNHLTSLQSQIDDLVGRQQYLQKSADLSKITIYLSTDDLSLPYAPTGQWRPLVTVKTAIRSLLGTLKDLGDLAIWALIYSPLIALTWLIFRIIKKRANLSKNNA